MNYFPLFILSMYMWSVHVFAHLVCGYTWLCLIVWNPDVDVMMSFLNLFLLTLLF